MARTKNKAHKIRTMLAKGKTVAEIIKATDATPSYVYAIKAKMRAVTPEATPTGSTGIAAVKRTSNVETGIGKIRLEPGSIMPTPRQPIENVKPSIWQRIKRVLGWQ